MENVFIKERNHGTFSWTDLANIKEGRGSLGEEMPVLVYRLMHFTMLDVLARDLGREKANHYIHEAGRLAGKEFTKNIMDISLPFDLFIASLQKTLQELKIGIMRLETFDEDSGDIMLTISEDLDCSGLPITGETVCDYDEGFIAGILELYTLKPYTVREIDCWANGNRVCRFKCTIDRQGSI